MIPLFDLTLQYRSIKQDLEPEVLAALEHAHYILGPEVAAFEAGFARYCGVRHAIAMNSGTSALHLALLAAGVGPDDEVITVPLTFVATVAAIRYTGARPVFVDVDPVSLTMDPTMIERAITRRTKAILPVHLYGQTADLDPIMEIAARRGLRVIEDSAQAHGAIYKGRRAGSIGHFGCFSFYPSKNLGACGEGGLVTTNSDDDARTLRMLRDWGQESKNQHLIKGYNYRMEGLQGAVLNVKLRRLEAWTEQRRAHARFYREALAGVDVSLPSEPVDGRHVYHLFVIQVAARERMLAALAESGIQTGVHYPVPVHLQAAHSDLGYRRGQFPIAERAADSVLSLPMFPELTADQASQVAEAVKQLAGMAKVAVA